MIQQLRVVVRIEIVVVLTAPLLFWNDVLCIICYMNVLEMFCACEYIACPAQTRIDLI